MEDSLPMTGRQKNRSSYGMTSDFRSICGIDPVVGIDLVVRPTLVVSRIRLLECICRYGIRTVILRWVGSGCIYVDLIAVT